MEELTAQVKALESSSGKSRELLLENEMLRTQLQQQQSNLDKLQVRPCAPALAPRLPVHAAPVPHCVFNPVCSPEGALFLPAHTARASVCA